MLANDTHVFADGGARASDFSSRQAFAESRWSMKAARIHKFGGPEVVVIDDLSRPNPSAGKLLVRVRAAGVAPWDAIIREGKSKVSPPLTLGWDLSGIVEEVGPGVLHFRIGDDVYGVTHAQFCGANAEFAVASAGMVAKKPRSLSHLEAASVPVVAVTAWQMLFEYAHVVAGQSILILGAGGNVGAYMVQLTAVKDCISCRLRDRRISNWFAVSARKQHWIIGPLTLKKPFRRSMSLLIRL
jgi:D-arabinose 1-dehydrogenase-like Zn-dependent alcohol dehydrogenase